MTRDRIETLDVFRGLAILMVVLYHFTARLPASALNMEQAASPQVSFGWIGVYFFFVISGYCILLTLERASSVPTFLTRRFSRIYPAFLAALIGLFVLGLLWDVPSVPEANYREVAPGLLDVLLNLVFLGELGEWINGSFWSIAVEVKFYLLLGLLAAFLGSGKRLAEVFFWLALALTVTWIAAALLSAPDQRITPGSLLQFLAIAPYLPFFGVGMLARRRQTGQPDGEWRLGTLILVCLLVLFVQVTGHGAGTLEVLGVLGVFTLLLWLFVRFIEGKPLPHVPVLSRTLAGMGFLSYSWYLVHETLGFTLMAAAGPYLPAWGNALFAAAATYGFALLFARAFEWRFRKSFEALALRVLEPVAHRLGAIRLRLRPVK